MRVTFVAHGWENISIEYLSAAIKQRGHQVALAYEQSLFNDKNYLCIPILEKALAQGDNILRQIVDTKPDLVAFSVMVFTYRPALDIARKLKKILDVPVIFGGAHAISCPERLIAEDCIDIVCVGEGEEAMGELLDSMQRGGPDTSIPGLWFKTPEGVVRNGRRLLIQDLDSLPLPDKELFAPVVPIKNYYLAVTNRGCPFSCTYCSVSYLTQLDKDLPGFKKVRERSVDGVIDEIAAQKERYGFTWVDFRNAVFSPNKDWILEFCQRWSREIRLPFRIFSHPLLIREDTSIALRDAGCFAIQMGLESYDPHVRCDILNRRETNEQIQQAIGILEHVGAPYSLDYILGLPEQEEHELKAAAELFSGLKHCYRISPFMISYLPKVPLVDYAIEHGILNPDERDSIESGEHGNYMDKGSQQDAERGRIMRMYKLLFRSMSFMPPSLRKAFYRSGLYKVFKWVPFDPILRAFDLTMVFRDLDAQAYAKNYWWWYTRRFDSSHPNYWRRRYRPSL